MREKLKGLLEDVDVIYVVGIHRDRYGRWTRFRLYFINPETGRLEQIWFPADKGDTPPYWVPLHRTKSGKWVGGYFECSMWNADRPFVVVYSLGRWLFDDGYKFKCEFLSYEQ